MDGTEKGVQRWQAFLTWVNTPPVQRSLPTGATRVGGESKVSALRAQAEAAVGNELAAFDAYAGAQGRR